MNDVFDSINEALESLTGDSDKSNISSDSQSETVKSERNLVGKICEGRAECGTQKGCVVIKEKPYKDRYMDSLSRVRKYIPAISKSLKCSSMEYKLIHRGMRSGMLDTGKIAKVLNAVLRTYTDCTVASVEGCWVFESKDGQRIPMTGIMATVPMTRKAKACKMDKYVTY